MKKMVTQEQEPSAIASYVKGIIEDETGEKYILKSRAELVHPDGLSWFLHTTIGKAVWLDHVQQEGRLLVFESGYFYDAHRVVEYEYRPALKIDALRSDLDRFDQKEMREKYSRIIPKVVKFFEMAEGTVSAVNKTHHTKLSLVNQGDGVMRVKIEIGVQQAQEQEALLRENLRAMKDFLDQVADWLNNQRKRSLHMAQIKSTHHKLMGTAQKASTN
jgi:hypothetical protein